MTVKDLAQKLLEAESGYVHSPYSPYGSGPPKLVEFWPIDQARFERMAEAMLKLKE